MRALEIRVCDQLKFPGVEEVRDGLSNVVYSGHGRACYHQKRVDEFRAAVRVETLQTAIKAFGNLSGPALVKLKKLRLPQLSIVISRQECDLPGSSRRPHSSAGLLSSRACHSCYPTLKCDNTPVTRSIA